jgi:hypothetical protein
MASDPFEESRAPSLALLLRLALRNYGKKIHTGLPGRVESYDADKQTADVLPLIQSYLPNEDGTQSVVTLPVLSSIPVAFMGGGGFRGTYPLESGDTGWIAFSEASLDAWQARGGLSDPQDERRFHLADSVFLPGLHADDRPWTNAGTDATWGKDGGAQVVATGSGLELGGNTGDRPTDFVALASLAKAELQSLRGTLSAAITLLQTHVHPETGASTGPSPTLAAMQQPAAIGDIKSANVKSK